MRYLVRQPPFISYSNADVLRISALADRLRSNLRVASDKRFPIVDFLEFEAERLWKDFRLVVDPDGTFDRYVLATAKLDPPEIKVRESVYQHAVVGSEAARLILAHELGHIVLAHGSSYHKQSDGQESFCIAEWEADEFAAELLMPSKVALQMGPETLARFFAVPLRSAQLRLETLKNRMNISSAKSIPRYEHHIDLLSKFDKDLLYWVPMRQRQVG